MKIYYLSFLFFILFSTTNVLIKSILEIVSTNVIILKILSPVSGVLDEFEFVVYSNENLYPIDAKKNKGNLNSLAEFRQFNPKTTGIKISSNNFGYNKENDILTIPHYAVFLLAEDLQEGTLKIE